MNTGFTRAAAGRPLRFLRTFSAPALLLASAACAFTDAGEQKHCLWSFQTEGKIIYLLGSVHVLTADSYPLPAPFEAAYADARNIVFETDIEVMLTPGFAFKVMQLGMYLDDTELQDKLSADTYTRLAAKLKQSGLPLAQFAKLKPWMVGFTLLTVELKRLGFDEDKGIDMHYFTRAKADGKTILHLESAAFQMGLLDDLADVDQVAFLEQTLDDLQTLTEESQTIVAAWQNGRTQELNALMNRSLGDHPELNRRLMTDRNRDWIPKIEALATADGNVLVVVGAGHLVGPESVVALLEKKGYTLVQH